MKKILLSIFVLIIASLLSWGQTTINFDTEANWSQDMGVSSLTAYGDHSYSESGVTIQGTSVLRNTSTTQDGFSGAKGSYSMRVRNVNGAKVVISVASGGISDFSIDVRRWDGSPMPDYTVKYSVNNGMSWNNLNNIDGSLLVTSDWFTYTGSINSGNSNIQIEIANTGTTERIMLDDFIWSAFSASTPTITAAPTSLSDFNYVAGSGPSESQSFTVEGTNLTGSVIISTPANFEISSDNVNFQTADLSYVPPGGTLAEQTLYVRLVSGLTLGTYTGNIEVSSTDATTRTIACAGYVEGAQFATLPYNNDFSSGFDDVNTYDAGGPAAWSAGSGYASINGFPNDNGVDEDWMILPGIDFSSYSDVELSFDMWWRFGNQDASNYLELYYSTNYNGYGDPSAASWTEIPLTLPADDQIWTSSGIIDLSSLTASNVNIAFKYRSDNAARQWQIDDILLQEDAPTPPPPPVVLPNAWINEFHYDNDGPDVDEMVEIVIENAGDFTLANFTLSLYNGNNGAVYGTHTLDGFTLGSTEGNYSVFYKSIPNIQNGAPDGFSLDYEGDLIQFISYEGDFVAAGGPADGVSSNDIGISQSSSSPIGYSLQLIGSGFEYNDFNWVLIPETAGLMNTNQFFGDPLPVVPLDWRFILAAFMLIALTVVYRKLR